MSFDSTAIIDSDDEPTRSIPVVPPRTDRRPPTPPPAPARVRRGHVTRGRTYEFSLDEAQRPIELGSGRFAKAFLGQERWIESKTAFRREVAIKVMQRGVSREDQLRFQLEKQILERVQGHPNIVQLLASGENDDPEFIPEVVRDRVDNDYMVLERLDMSLEERLKGSRANGGRDDLLAVATGERLFRVLDYLVPIASAIEFAHLERDTCHRDLKPANVLLRLPSPRLRGAQMEVKLADFNVGKARDPDDDVSMTRVHTVPGTLYFQSPEQETNSFELLVNVRRGSPDVNYFEDFYIDIFENDMFSLFNQSSTYRILGADRARKKLRLAEPYGGVDESNVRARVIKAVGRPADIYSLGAMFYYLISGAYSNPKSLYDSFRKFIEWDAEDESNTIESYLEHEYGKIRDLRAPRSETSVGELPPEDRFFTYKQYLDGNGELIPQDIMLIISRAMIRNKPDSYCRSWDLETEGIALVVNDLLELYMRYGVNPAARQAWQAGRGVVRDGGVLRRAWRRLRNR